MTKNFPYQIEIIPDTSPVATVFVPRAPQFASKYECVELGGVRAHIIETGRLDDFGAECARNEAYRTFRKNPTFIVRHNAQRERPQLTTL